MSSIREVYVGDRCFVFEFNKFAKQADGSVMISCGDTQVLVTACVSDEPLRNINFFPLTIDYIEKFYAAGRIPGGFIKRETRPSNEEVRVARVIDRPIRPSFPKGFRHEVQIVATVLSYDKKNHPAPLALIGASTALMISSIPFQGPIAALKVSLVDGEYLIAAEPQEKTELDLNISAKLNAVVMVEAKAKELTEEKMLEAIHYAHESMKPLLRAQEEFQKEFGKLKLTFSLPDTDNLLREEMARFCMDRFSSIFSTKEKTLRRQSLSVLLGEIKQKFITDKNEQDVLQLFEDLQSDYVRRKILKNKIRIDGRGVRDIRPITCEIGTLKRTHGSAMFTRGETQALSIITLGAKEDTQGVDSIIKPNHSQEFYLHYNFPGFSVGEVKPLRAPSRREIGHGGLAEMALSYVIPDEEAFGYTIRVVSEILESNGSSSMATVCASSMALYHAGVPISEHVAGIAMGLVGNDTEYEILTDILGDEDHLGDMDFKVCGTRKGITALQMDIKISGLSKKVLNEALEQARDARLKILEQMVETIDKPQELSTYAPRIQLMKINVNKIRDLIGPGGKMIKKIVADTGVKLDVEDNGVVKIVAPDLATAEKAKNIISEIVATPEIGKNYLGTVKTITDFGAFIEIKPGQEGLCHISNLENRRVKSVEDVVQLGEKVLVKLIDIDRQGKLKLSRKDAVDDTESK